MAVNQDLERFIGGSMDKGISLFASAIDVNISWASEVFNVTSGIHQGVGPRYGLAPLPGQVYYLDPAAGELNNLSRATGPTGNGLKNRCKIYAIYYSPTMGCYFAVIGVSSDGVNVSFDVVATGELSGSRQVASDTFTAGWTSSGYNQQATTTPARIYRVGEYLPWPKDNMTITTFENYFKSKDPNYVSSAHFNITGKDVSYQWMLGNVTVAPTATSTPNVVFGNATFAVAPSAAVRLGVSTRFNVLEQRVKENPRVARYYCLDNNGYPISDLIYECQITDAIISASPGLGGTQVYAPVTSGVTKIGNGTAYSSATNVLLFDSSMTTRSRRDVVMVCGEVPLAVVFQDGIENPDGLVPRYFDLSATAAKPRRIGVMEVSPTAEVTETALLPNASWGDLFIINPYSDWLGGLFEFEVPYEIGVAYYNKPLDYESNVEHLIGFQQAKPEDYSLNNFSLIISNFTGGYNLWRQLQANNMAIPFEFADVSAKSGYPAGQGLSINDFSYRFYYREAGIGEWLPLEEYDAAKLWFFRRGTEFPGPPLLGKTPTARTPGGAPNAFQDYSPLPKLPYFQVLNFAQRAFWFESGSFRFSSSTHEFHYPTRNIVNSATGQWLGAMVFTRQNDIAAQSVLIIFSEQATYMAQFTGNMATEVVRVSAREVGEFTVDGSDFTIDILTDLTAFSYRSAVLAEGEAYWWGPQGIVYYGGRGAPEVISVPLESDNPDETIFNLPDPTQVGKIHGVYSPLTSEVIWFYTPAIPDPNFPTHYLCFNTQSRQYMRGKLACQIDNAQNVNIGGLGYAPKSEGSRLVVYGRPNTGSFIQSAFLFDSKNPLADMPPGRELIVASVASPTANTRRLTFAATGTTSLISTIALGDYILVHSVASYAPALTGTNTFIAKVSGINLLSNYVDITLPQGAAMDATFTATAVTGFPVYHRAANGPGINGIPWVVQTNFWLPNGLVNSYVWQYLHMLFKYVGIPQPTNAFDKYPELARIIFQNKTLRCDGPSTTELILLNNSSNHCQIHHRVKNENRSANGQALAMRFSGIAFGDPWTLEYLEAQCILEKGLTLKEFQQ
jgi:hypothetical protein